MTVSLNIENDAELRAYIKDCIKGQVLAIVREEFLDIVREEFVDKVRKSRTVTNLDSVIQNAVNKIVKDTIHDKLNISEWSKDSLIPLVNQKLDAMLSTRDWDGLVNKLAIQKVQALIK